MSNIHELRQMLWLDTPKGLALAKFLIDRGIDSDNEWVCVVNDTGEIWSWARPEQIATAKRCLK